MIREATRHVVDEAERIAAGGDVRDCLACLRRLPLDDFGILLWSLPSAEFPSISALLPRMASAETQTAWTGAAGFDLLRTTTAIARLFDSLSWRVTGKGLSGKRLLDFGCGYGRIMRLIYYFTDPNHLIGADAWSVSLDLCRSSRMPSDFIKTDDLPETIDIERVDISYAYSVFTHLSPEAASAALAALRDVTREMLILTIRPIEFWTFFGNDNALPVRELMETHRRNLFAFHAHEGRANYGDTSIHLDYFRQLPNWELVMHDRVLTDPYQSLIVLKPS